MSKRVASFVLVLIFSLSSLGSECISFYNLPTDLASYNLKNFKKELRAESKSVSTFPEKNRIIKAILSRNLAKMSTQDFTDIALYIVKSATIYVGGRGGISSDYVIEAFKAVQEASLRFDLTEDQTNQIRDAILNRPNSYSEWFRALGHFGWSDGGAERVRLLVELPFGKKNYPRSINENYSVANFKTELNYLWSYLDTKPAMNATMGQLLVKYAAKLSANEFTDVCLWLINWKLVYYNPYFGLDGHHTVQGFEAIRQATLLYNLGDERIYEIKSAMRKRSRSLQEIIASRGTGLAGWDDYAALEDLLKLPFGHQKNR